MKKKTLAPGIVLYSEVIKDSSGLVEGIESEASKIGLNWSLSEAVIDGVVLVDATIRDSDAIYIDYQDYEFKGFMNEQHAFSAKLGNIFYSSFKDLEADYKNEYGITTSWHDMYGILKYGPGQKIVNHIDDNIKFNRKVSTVYYINDNYTGGEIVFPRFDLTYKPVANDLLIFPSTYVYNHSVLPVIEGTRYSVVSWLR
jgi:Rps23 Pro-64 3,4-dihydroxylase Tpa1-like proline 4-hydroxylase